MFKNSCETSLFLENLTSELLELETGSANKWKVRETSITDTIIATFRAHGSAFSVEVDASIESKTNADFEVIFRKGGKDLGVLFQAKRVSVLGSGNYNIPELFHPNSSGSQNKCLIDYASIMKVIPFYSLFLSKAAISKESTGGSSPTGIMCQRASTIRAVGFKKLGKNKLSLSAHLTGSIPFHRFFCLFERISVLDDFAQIFGEETNIRDFIVSEIDLLERRNRDDGRVVAARILLSRN